MRFSFLPLSVAVLALAGCGAQTYVTIAPPTTGGAIKGSVQGGQQAIQGAHVYLMAVGTSGYGGQSVSLLNNVAGQTSADTTTFPGQTIYYVTTSSAATGGTFSITGDYTCTPGQAVYLLATGGSPDGGAHTNSAIAMMAGLGTCPSTGTLATQTPSVDIDEVTTVATAYALAGFATDALDISSSGSTLAVTGVTNAINNVGNIVNIANGTVRTMTSAGNGFVNTQGVNTIANILAACVNSTSNVSTFCSTLFAGAVNGSTQPTNTANAAINLAHYPEDNVSSLYALQTGTSPFANGYSSQPNDFTVWVQYPTNAGPSGIAVDGSGNVWVANTTANTVSKLSPAGVNLSGTGFTGSLNGPTGIAIDLSGNAWVTNATGNTVAEFNSSGAVQSGSGFTTTGLSTPQGIAIVPQLGYVLIANKGNSSVSYMTTSGASQTTTFTGNGQLQSQAVALDGQGYAWVPSLNGRIIDFQTSSATVVANVSGGGLTGSSTVAIDGTGNVWVTNLTNDTLSKFNHSSMAVSGSGGYTGGGIDTAAGIMIDGAGSVWIANYGGNSVSHFASTGTPITGNVGYQPGVSSPEGLAIDPSGNLWLASNTTNYAVQVLGAAAPVITPLVAGNQASFNTTGLSNLGTRP